MTTCVGGNCGVGFAPCRKSMRDWTIDLCEGVEDIPHESLAVGMPWEWESFPEYLDAVARRPLALDIGFFISHGPLRAYCMGEECNATDKPGGRIKAYVSDSDIEKMKRTVKEAIEAGALGFSTNRFQGHRDTHGTLIPGTCSTDYEQAEICKGMAEGGGGVYQMVSDMRSYDDFAPAGGKSENSKQHRHYLSERDVIGFIGSNYGVKVLKSSAVQNDMKDANAMHKYGGKHIKLWQDAGTDVTFQTYVRSQAMITNWDSRSNYFRRTKTFRGVAGDDVPREQRMKALRDPNIRIAILSEMDEIANGTTRLSKVVQQFWYGEEFMGWTYVINDDFDFEPGPEHSVLNISKRTGKRFVEVMYDQLNTYDGHGQLWRPMEAYYEGSYEVTKDWLMQDFVVPGISDAGAHLALFQDAVASTYMLTHWARDRKRGSGTIPIELAVKKHTHDTARTVGLLDRGTLEVGMKADINVVDYQNLKINPYEYKNDLPANAPRWYQTVDGYKYTFVSGVMTYKDGKHTGALPGGLVRNQYAWKGRGRDHTATYKDEIREEVYQNYLDNIGKVVQNSGTSDNAKVLDMAMEGGFTGPTYSSRLLRTVDEEGKEEAQKEKQGKM